MTPSFLSFLTGRRTATESAPETSHSNVSLACFPPIGQVTQAPCSEVSFCVVLDVEKNSSSQTWQVALWYAEGAEPGPDWVEKVLEPGLPEVMPAAVHALESGTVRRCFTAKLALKRPLNFTVKFRSSADAPWRWVRDEVGLADGIVLVATARSVLSAESIPESLDDVVDGLNPDLKITSHLSESPRTRLWSAETVIGGASGHTPATLDIPFGAPWGGFLRWFAIVRDKSAFMAPRQGNTTLQLDHGAVLCSFLSSSGMHLVLLAVSGLESVMTLLSSQESNRVGMNVRNDGEAQGRVIILAAVGYDFESANAAVMYHLRNEILSSKGVAQPNDRVETQWREEWHDGLGFCTWNSLGQKFTEDKLMKALDSLADDGIRVRTLIIDDGWQSVDSQGRGWKEFEASSSVLPDGLKSTVSRIRQRHGHIRHVAVWHALLGYWGGISPRGSIAKAYKTYEVMRGDTVDMTVVAAEDVAMFYDDFYRFLASCGIGGVKTDGQCMMDEWASARAKHELTFPYLDAWTVAYLRHFGTNAISCMSQVPSIMFRSQLPANKPAILCRNSDDFFPTVDASHAWHVWTNAHNSLLTHHLNVVPDWDMFQTAHDWGAFHGAARCVSGGPVYITDAAGQHDASLVKQMTGTTPLGDTVVFRPSVLGRSIDQYVGYEDRVLAKVSSYHGAARTGTSILGLFNVSDRPLTELIPLSRLPGVLPDLRYVVRAHGTGRVTPPMQTSSASSSLICASLGLRGYEILSAYPLESFDSHSRGGPVLVANLGLLRKMTGAAAVAASRFAMQENGRLLLETRLKAVGVLGVYISALPGASIADDFIVLMQGAVIPYHTASASPDEPCVLEVDLETAWRELGLGGGFSNEIEVRLFFNLDKKA